MPAAPASSLQTVASADGTAIRFELRGSGPGVVLVQGAMGTAYNFRDLADALAPHFTVVLPDRRGRGSSGEGRSPYRLRREVEDLDAVVRATGAEGVFGQLRRGHRRSGPAWPYLPSGVWPSTSRHSSADAGRPPRATSTCSTAPSPTAASPPPSSPV